MTKEYVLCQVYHEFGDHIVYVLKDRPEAQRGKINLPGGKVEPGETPYQALLREMKEELGVDPEDSDEPPRLMGVISGYWGKIYCYKARPRDFDISPRPGETEEFFWGNIDVSIQDLRCMPNLKLITTLIHSDIDEWTIIDNNPSLETRPYTVSFVTNDPSYEQEKDEESYRDTELDNFLSSCKKLMLIGVASMSLVFFLSKIFS